jgi:hypothetical protein
MLFNPQKYVYLKTKFKRNETHFYFHTIDDEYVNTVG